MRAGGILPAIVGTLYLTIGTAIFAVPLGIGAAIYLSEYSADNRWTRMIRIAIINLAGIPSVVYGLFGLGLFVIFLHFGTSILAGSLTLGIMTIPVIISTAEEALRSVPQSFRIVSISLGATRWQTIRRIVIPEALPGILTGVILGLERAAGETAPILFTVAAFFLPRLPNSPLDGRWHSLPPLCDINPGSWYANSNTIRNCVGAHVLCPIHEYNRRSDSLARPCSTAVVMKV
jgi:phosphate transport system permease protein